MSSKVITERLEEIGYTISERTVRFHLLSLGKSGLTICREKHGRIITKWGLSELEDTRV